MVDKNLFLYDLAVVAIMKNEAPYLKEWLDYHLLAGVEHFYIYDNGSADNQAEVAASYVERGLVDYIPAPGDVMQMPVYNDAVRRFRFRCRYMAFIDADEFIHPKIRDGKSRAISEVVDEILQPNPNAGALGVNWQMFGSNDEERADYSRGVLERFTRRAESDWTPKGKGNAHVKTIANPRMIHHVYNPHCAKLFDLVQFVNENAQPLEGMPNAFNLPVSAEKIAVHHYFCKSLEEFWFKLNRGRSDQAVNDYHMGYFKLCDRNEVSDESILDYIVDRAENLSFEDGERRLRRVTDALTGALSSPAGVPNLETALTCRDLSAFLRENLPNDAERWKSCEEAALEAIVRILTQYLKLPDAQLFLQVLPDVQLFIRALPDILHLPYPDVPKIRRLAEQILRLVMEMMKLGSVWEYWAELDHILYMIKSNPIKE